MTAWALAYVRRHSSALARLRDYVELTKPRIAIMELVTVATAAWLAAWGPADLVVVLHALIGTALVAASGSAANQWLEQQSDARMPRTKDRPLPSGRLTSQEVLVFAAVTIVAGVGYLTLMVNSLTALIALATWVLYVPIYTPLKARSISNTAVGAVAGALPVLIGWSAVGGRFDLMAATLFLILYLWQFPHFMAIAWMYRDDYELGGLKMLPCVDADGTRTARQAFVGALLLLPVSLIPALARAPQWSYVGCALLLGGTYIAAATLFLVRKDDANARLLLRVSLLYLPALLGALALMPVM